MDYDLLLYWAILRKERAHFDDGFRRRDDLLVHVDPGSQTVSWLHGALHLHEELIPGAQPLTVKSEWTSLPLVDALREDLGAGTFPLIVMEGTWRQKQRRINSSPYLSNALERLRRQDGALFTLGWSMAENDEHILTAIGRSHVRRLCVGLFGTEREGTNPDTIGAANRLKAQTGDRLQLEFWNSSTARVW